MRIRWGISRSVVREGEIVKEGDHSAEGLSNPDRDKFIPGFCRAVARRCGSHPWISERSPLRAWVRAAAARKPGTFGGRGAVNLRAL